MCHIQPNQVQWEANDETFKLRDDNYTKNLKFTLETGTKMNYTVRAMESDVMNPGLVFKYSACYDKIDKLAQLKIINPRKNTFKRN